MAKFVLTDARVEINGVVLSDHVRSVTINSEHEDIDITAMGATARERLPGLADDNFEIEFFSDFAAASIDATLFPLKGSATGFTVKVRPTSAAISATNPEYSATCILLNYSALDGEVGEASTTTVTFPTKTGAITRAVA